MNKYNLIWYQTLKITLVSFCQTIYIRSFIEVGQTANTTKFLYANNNMHIVSKYRRAKYHKYLLILKNITGSKIFKYAMWINNEKDQGRTS